MSHLLFMGIIAAFIGQRLWELNISRRHAEQILTRGGVLHHDNYLGQVKLLQVSWLICMGAEVWWFDRPFQVGMAIAAIALVLTGQLLRYLSMKALGWRWTLLLMTVPTLPAVNQGIYQYLRHPNWLGVMLEIAGLPLVHGAYLTAGVFTVLNGFIMYARMNLEEQTLISHTNYASASTNIPSLISIKYLLKK